MPLKERLFAAAESFLCAAARRDARDRFKPLILAASGLLKYAAGLRDEALLYFSYAGLPPRRRAGMLSNESGKYYETIEDKNYPAYLSSSKQLVEFTAPAMDAPICDVGCGRGFLVRDLRGAGYSGAEGIEVSAWAVENRVSPNVSLKSPGDLPAGAFVTVSLISVLEHLEKGMVADFLGEIARISSDYVVCCIPLYPNNLMTFFSNGADHRILERREWWDERFRAAGLFPAYLPAAPLPFVLPFVYRKEKSGPVWSAKRRNLVRMRMGMGDEICVLPVLAAAKRLFPGMVIAVSEDSYHLEIFRGSPYVDEAGARPAPGDNIVEFHYQERFDRTMPQDFAAQAGIPLQEGEVPVLVLAANERYPLRRGKGPCIAMDTRANWVSRKWPHVNFEALAGILKSRYGAMIVEVGQNRPFEAAGQEPEYLAAADICYADRLSVRQTASVLAQCDCFVGSDSGLSHLAAAVGCKAVTLFGPVEARYRAHKGLTVPVFDTECYGCFSSGLVSHYEIARRCPRGHHKCMKKIAPEKVAEVIAAELGLRG